MDCPRCNRLLRANAVRCACGWVVPKESKLHVACAYLPCETSATMSVKNKHGWINVCEAHYERWVDDGMEAGPRAAHFEERARETARRFGVNENQPPRDRCLAIAKKLGIRLQIREPGCDDE